MKCETKVSRIDLAPVFELSGSNLEQLQALESLLKESETGMKGIEELRFVVEKLEELNLESASLVLDITLARGLNYYTGAIFEVQTDKVRLGSIGGGGRYDDLTGIFGLKGMSGIGISFGLDRIYMVLEELELFDEGVVKRPTVLFVNFGEQESLYALKSIQALRRLGIRAELYPSSAKMKKQMNYADKREIPFVVLAGEQEMNTGTYGVKNMRTGEQQNCSQEDLTRLLSAQG